MDDLNNPVLEDFLSIVTSGPDEPDEGRISAHVVAFWDDTN